MSHCQNRSIGSIPPFICFALVLTLLGPTRSHAANKPEQVAPKPLVLLISVADDPSRRAIENDLTTELALALDRFTVGSITEHGPRFTALSSADQLERIERDLTAHEATAALWLQQKSTDSIGLHLVVIGEGRAVLRIVEIGHGPDAAVELAVAARELLDQAIVSEDQIADSGPPMNLVLQGTGLLRGGVAGHRGPSLLWGAQLAVQFDRWDQLFVRGALGVTSGPLDQTGKAEVEALGIHPGVIVGYRWRCRMLSFGPLLGAGPSWLRVYFPPEANETPRRHTSWRLRLDGGAHLGLTVTQSIDLLLAGTLSVYTNRERYVTILDRQELMVTPFLEWGVQLGLALHL